MKIETNDRDNKYHIIERDINCCENIYLSFHMKCASDTVLYHDEMYNRGLERYSFSVMSLSNWINGGTEKELYSQSSQTSKIEIFTKTVSSWKRLLVIFAKRFILDVWLTPLGHDI